MTTGADSNYQSIGPIFFDIESDEIRDSRPNWFPAWSPDELSQMRKDDTSKCKMERENPVLDEIEPTNSAINVLWCQLDYLEVKTDTRYRRRKDNKSDTIFH